MPDGGADGVIIAQGGRFGGWAVYAKDGAAKFVYNVLGIHEYATTAGVPIPSGTHQVRIEFAYDGGGLAKGGDVALYYDGESVGTGRVEQTQPMVFSADETTDIGYESGRPFPRTTRAAVAGSPARSTGSSSTSASTTTTTSSTPRSDSALRWLGSSRRAVEQAGQTTPCAAQHRASTTNGAAGTVRRHSSQSWS